MHRLLVVMDMVYFQPRRFYTTEDTLLGSGLVKAFLSTDYGEQKKNPSINRGVYMGLVHVKSAVVLISEAAYNVSIRFR